MGALAAIMKVIFFVGIILVVIGLTKSSNQCPAPQVVYRYVPRTFTEDQENPVPLDDIFYNMFNNPTPWVSSVDVQRRRNDIGENLNRYYVSQI